MVRNITLANWSISRGELHFGWVHKYLIPLLILFLLIGFDSLCLGLRGLLEIVWIVWISSSINHFHLEITWQASWVDMWIRYLIVCKGWLALWGLHTDSSANRLTSQVYLHGWGDVLDAPIDLISSWRDHWLSAWVWIDFWFNVASIDRVNL